MKDVKSKTNKGICEISTLFLQLSYNSKIKCKNFLKETKTNKKDQQSQVRKWINFNVHTLLVGIQNGLATSDNLKS